ncbi:predicted protein [Naegleria gruberi]|uniref:Predicted protein n=1 Tax=Naegleria gruberi TaxID=5762 RepID=D2V6H1_NAEGR|nr:uncharacterized protein NAEGRDRAFT_64436 [Naegleria gruberi]EFC47446.1 predicted protein [Naegleria gruberi]|eukprot:XP_002680190.1 predicted protein [Naegleria gruberi strain NEG-M]
MATSKNQLVLTMSDYYDCPLHGVANLFDQPHIYEKHGTIDNDFEPFYYLKPIYDTNFLKLLLEDWDIWVRYYDTMIRNELGPKDLHPCLAIDQERSKQVEELLKKYSYNISTEEVDQVIKAYGEFTPKTKVRGVAKPDTVNWSNIEYGANYSVLNFLSDTRGVIKRDKLTDVTFEFKYSEDE